MATVQTCKKLTIKVVINHRQKMDWVHSMWFMLVYNISVMCNILIILHTVDCSMHDCYQNGV